MKYLLCVLWYKEHDPIRHPLGGFRCSRCNHAEDAALGYVPTLRVIRGRKETVRFWGF